MEDSTFFSGCGFVAGWVAATILYLVFEALVERGRK